MRRYLKGKNPDYTIIINNKIYGNPGDKIKKKDIETPDLAIRVQILYESDSTLHLSIMLVVSRNGEPSLILSITTKTHGIYIYPINIKLKSLQIILRIKLRTIGLRLKNKELSLLYGRNMLSISITSSLILRIAGITHI